MPVRGLAGLALANRLDDVAAALFLGFVGLLRTGEILGARFGHFLLYQRGSRAILLLPESTSGAHGTFEEKVVISDPLAIQAVLRARRGHA